LLGNRAAALFGRHVFELFKELLRKLRCRFGAGIRPVQQRETPRILRSLTRR
jgi:hypothetical protein